MISLFPDDVERLFVALGIPNRFTAEEKSQLSTTNIVAAEDNIIGFPTPAANAGLNLLKLRQLLGTDTSRQPSFFEHPWYLDEAFAREDCQSGWHYVFTTVLPDSISQPFDYANSLSPRGFELPSAVEITLMVFLHYAGSRQQLLQKKHTWCKDQASMNRCVTVGAFGRNGLFVSGHPPEFRSRGLGICPKIIR